MSATVTSGLSPVRRLVGEGIPVVVQETAFSPAVTFTIAFRAGSLYEPDELAGLAAFSGRVIDRGTTSRAAAAIAEALDDRGVSLRIVTNRHVASFSCTCLAEDFGDLLTLVADIVRDPIYPQDEIDKRRAETITAIRQDQDNPAIRASETLQSWLYGESHPYGRPAKGRLETVERFTRERLQAHHAARYAPSTEFVVVVGDVRAEEAIDRMAKAFDGWSAAPGVECELPPVPKASTRREARIEMPDKPQADIAYGFTTIGRLDPSYCAHWMMNMILGQIGLGGRLADNIRERQGMAYYAYSSFDPSLGPGPLVIRAGVDPQNVEKAVAAIDHEVGSFGRDGASEQEIADARRYMIGSIPRMLENNAMIATFLQTVEFFDLGLDYDRRLPGLLDRVTRDEVNAAAASVLDPARATLAIAAPPR
jgi:zinc protease